MILHIKLRARALQQQHRALFAAVFALRVLLFLLPASVIAAAALFFRGPWLAVSVSVCAPVLLWGSAVGSLGGAFCFSALAEGREATLRLFFSAFRRKNQGRAAASFLLSAVLQSVLLGALSVPAAAGIRLLLGALRRGLPAVSGVLLAVGTAAAAAATVLLGLRVHALFSLRSLFLAQGCTARKSVCLCLRIGARETRRLLALRRSFFGWNLLSLLLVPLPFVRGYVCQSRALLFSAMNLCPTS